MAFAAPLALAGGIAGAGLGAFGQIAGGNATKAADYYSSAVAQNNAITAQRNAAYAVAAGQREAADQSLKNAQVAGKIKTGQAASGVDVNSGSAVDVQASSRGLGQLDTETKLNNAALTAYGYQTQATSDLAQAKLDQAAGSQAQEGADIGAAGSLLSSASSVGLKYSQLFPSGGGQTTGGGSTGVTGG